MLDVLIAGAGPAGSIAGLVLARAGARVVIVDRDAFPRAKLCGDTLNPGAVGLLESLGLRGGPLATARPLAGMLVSGPHAQGIGRYARGRVGLAITRRDLDAWLLGRAIDAGARFEPGLVARRPLVDTVSGRPLVKGLVLERRDGARTPLRMPASMTIAADGRRSMLAASLGLSSHPRRPRRWAFGVYAEAVRGVSGVGELHVRPGYYVGITPLSDALVNVCVVTGPRPDGRTPLEIVQRAIARAPEVAARFADARFVSAVGVVGPLAVDVTAAGVDGLLLAGDAAGFIDPMTGDGLHLAMRGAVLAAREILHVLEVGDLTGAPERLARARRAGLAAKLRFNRALRRLVGSPAAIGVAEWGARILPGALTRLVNIAGDAA
jgi:flavin-dependent dehydrogenase